MQLTISTPNLFGHIIRDEYDAGDTPDFTGERTALCGAEGIKHIPRARYVCGRCVAVLLAERESVNRVIDVLETHVRTSDRVVDTLISLLPEPEVVPGDPEHGGADEPGTPDAVRPEEDS